MAPGRRAHRRAGYPNQHVARALHDAVQRKIAETPRLKSQAGVGNWLGYDRSKFNNWLTGYSHPRAEEDWQNLCRLGLTRKGLRELELLDLMDAFRLDEDLSGLDLAAIALDVASDTGVSTEEIMDLLEDD